MARREKQTSFTRGKLVNAGLSYLPFTSTFHGRGIEGKKNLRQWLRRPKNFGGGSDGMRSFYNGSHGIGPRKKDVPKNTHTSFF